MVYNIAHFACNDRANINMYTNLESAQRLYEADHGSGSRFQLVSPVYRLQVQSPLKVFELVRSHLERAPMEKEMYV